MPCARCGEHVPQELDRRWRCFGTKIPPPQSIRCWVIDSNENGWYYHCPSCAEDATEFFGDSSVTGVGPDDHKVLKMQVRACWEEVVATARMRGGLDLHGLTALCSRVEQSIGVPAAAFGQLEDTYHRFDFNGDGVLDFNEAYRCVRCCIRDYRKLNGLSRPPQVPFRTPEEGGFVKIRVLAAGGQGEATLVRDRFGKEVVLKSYSRDNQNAGGMEELIEEAEHMNEVRESVNIATCIEIFQDDLCFYMIGEFNSGGDFTTLKKKASEQRVSMSEAWYQGIFRQAFSALSYMHRNALMHCDIKEPNIMLRDAQYANPQVVIIDLGLSQALFLDEGGGPCGTPGYIPPETWKSGKWFPRGDMFSMGVVCYQLLADMVPDERSGQEGLFTDGCATMDEIISATSSRRPSWSRMNPQSQALLDWLTLCLEVDKMKRLRAPQILDMPWFSKTLARPAAAPRSVALERLQAPAPDIGAKDFKIGFGLRDGSIREVAFTKTPLGLELRQNVVPVAVEDIVPGGVADALGVRVGWEIATIQGESMVGCEYGFVASKLLAAQRTLNPKASVSVRRVVSQVGDTGTASAQLRGSRASTSPLR